MRLRAVLFFFFFFLHDFPFVVFVGGDFAEFETIPERVGEIKVGKSFHFCGFGALKVLEVLEVSEVKVVIVFVTAFVVAWTAATHVATSVENFARVLFLFLFFVVFG